MNTALPLGHRDPRTEMVPGTYLHLAADLLTSRQQDLTYWNTVKVPSRPTDRVAFEELRQLAVFLPLVLVALAFLHFGFVASLVAFVVALPVMVGLHTLLQRAIRNKGVASARRDGGRYAFTRFMCSEFGLKPEDVTMGLVLKMCKDFNVWITTATGLRLRREAAARKTAGKAGASAAAADLFDVAPPARRGLNITRDVAGASAVASAAFAPVGVQVNPATGLPMVDGVVDVHGNTFGTSNIDDLFRDAAGVHVVDDHLHGVAHVNDQFGGFDPGFGGFGHH